MGALLVSLSVLDIAVLGIMMMFQRHRWYLAQHRRFATWFWRRYRMQIIWFCIGFAAAIYACTPRSP